MDAAATIEALRAELALERARAQRAHDEARTDDMTGLGNRRRWRETIEALQAAGAPFAVVLFDLANLKAANSVLGHAGADALLREVTGCIRAETDLAMRLGGDEFAVVLPGADVAGGAVVRDRIEQRAGERAIAPGATVFLAGDVTTWEPGADLHERMQAADFGLERRKADRKRALGQATTREATLATLAA